jgi:hypothetical protein
MTGFLLSPGLTPELTDVFVIEVPLALGAGMILARRTGLGWALLLNLLVLGIIKYLTDASDLHDDIVSIGAMVSAIAVGLSLRVPRVRGLRVFEFLLGLFALGIGIWKAVSDFYDPFDLLLSDMLMLAGLWLLIGMPRPRYTWPLAWVELPERKIEPSPPVPATPPAAWPSPNPLARGVNGSRRGRGLRAPVEPSRPRGSLLRGGRVRVLRGRGVPLVDGAAEIGFVGSGRAVEEPVPSRARATIGSSSTRSGGEDSARFESERCL